MPICKKHKNKKIKLFFPAWCPHCSMSAYYAQPRISQKRLKKIYTVMSGCLLPPLVTKALIVSMAL